MPPPAEGLAPRLIIRPALRSQPDRRLVTLVREGYELAFEEIVRRYGRPLGRYAASIVGGRSEDVTQDAFSKALLALRRTDAEIELRPWLYRIVRNTALNDLRDRPPVSELADTVPAARGPAEQVEQREELLELTRRLQALPEPQRAAIVMRELEGLGHDEIAAALGLSGGAARQAIYRARATLRDGLGMLVPLPLVKALLSEDLTRHAEVAVGSAGTGMALKATAATLLVAGTVGAGVVLHGDPGATESAATAHAATTRHADSAVAAPAGGPLRGDHGSATSSQSGRNADGSHGARHAGDGAEGHPGSGGDPHSTDTHPSPMGHDGEGSGSGSTSGGEHSGSASGGSGSGSGDLSSGSGDSTTSGSSGSGGSGSGGDSGSGDVSGSPESSGSDSGSSSDGGSTESTETASGGSESTSDGISGETRDSSSGGGLIEEMSPLN